MSNFDAIKLSVEASMPNNTVLFDDKGMPSIMVKIPKFKISDVIGDGSDTTHPAFVVDGVEKDYIYISKYQNTVIDDRAYSLPMQNPKTHTTFDQAKQYSENKGKGWHLMTNAEWSAIALWCLKNGFMPRGNNNYGSDHSAAHEKGAQTLVGSDGLTNRVATGSGPVTWAHNGDSSGIYDLNGNIAEWVGGFRLNDGEIQIIPDNNAATTGTNQTASSPLWKGVTKTGNLVAPGSTGTLKYDTDAKLVETITGATGQTSVAFQSMSKDASIETVPEILKALGLFPADTELGGDFFYINNQGERLACRGGYWTYTSAAGVFSLSGNGPRSHSSSDVGFRAAFVD